MKNSIKEILPLAAIAAGVVMLKNKTAGTSGVGVVDRKKIGKLIVLNDKRYSIYGNPSYHLTVLCEDGEVLDGRSAPNASLGYQLESWMINKDYLWEYHYTKSGKVLFTYCRKADGKFLWE